LYQFQEEHKKPAQGKHLILMAVIAFGVGFCTVKVISTNVKLAKIRVYRINLVGLWVISGTHSMSRIVDHDLIQVATRRSSEESREISIHVKQ